MHRKNLRTGRILYSLQLQASTGGAWNVSHPPPAGKGRHLCVYVPELLYHTLNV